VVLVLPMAQTFIDDLLFSCLLSSSIQMLLHNQKLSDNPPLHQFRFEEEKRKTRKTQILHTTDHPGSNIDWRDRLGSGLRNDEKSGPEDGRCANTNSRPSDVPAKMNRCRSPTVTARITPVPSVSRDTTRSLPVHVRKPVSG
jgi:hypothetical protein